MAKHNDDNDAFENLWINCQTYLVFNWLRSSEETLKRQLKCHDGDHLHFNERGVITTEHFQMALHSSTLSPQLIKSLTIDWVANHVRLIRQKLIAYDRQFNFITPCHTTLNILKHVDNQVDNQRGQSTTVIRASERASNWRQFWNSASIWE